MQDGSYVYVKWHFRPDEGIKTMDSDTAVRLAGSEPDYHVKDLFKAIEKGDFPTWSVCIQVMKPEDVKTAPIDIFDDTYTWPFEQYPLRRIGRLTFNKNVSFLLLFNPNILYLLMNLTSLIITSRISNKPASRLRTWFQASDLLPTQVCENCYPMQ